MLRPRHTLRHGHHLYLHPQNRPVELESESEAEELGRKVRGSEEDGQTREVKPAALLMRVITRDWLDSDVTR